jgi:alcohol dehydrogenase
MNNSAGTIGKRVGADFGPPSAIRLPRTVLFGNGQRAAIAEAVARVGRTALICTDSRLAASTELSEMLALLRSAGVRVTVFAETPPELPVSAIDACVSRLADTQLEVIIGFGGGSCLDMAKVVALVLTHGGQVSDYYGEFRVPGPVRPIVAIPTTAGTGSEATPVAVVTDPHRAIKVGISSPHLIPDTAICDPSLTLTCPAELTAATGADALAHLVEAFTAVRRPPTALLAYQRVFIGKSQLTDGIALRGIKLMGRSLLRAYQHSSDIAARQDVMAAALAGGIALGTAGTAAAHALQYPLGALTHSAHGVGVGVLLPYVMRYNFPACVPEFAQIGRALTGDTAAVDDLSAAHRALKAVDALIAGLGLPSTLAELGLSGDQIGRVADLGLGAARLVENNPRLLDRAAMLAIVRAAYDGDRTVAAESLTA